MLKFSLIMLQKLTVTQVIDSVTEYNLFVHYCTCTATSFRLIVEASEDKLVDTWPDYENRMTYAVSQNPLSLLHHQ